jgi:hypothetical protein
MEYRVARACGEPDWDGIADAELNCVLWKKRPEGLRAWGQVCYDDKGLKVRLRAEEREILSRSGGLTDFVHIDSALEFFISPAAGDGRYFNFEFNPKGTIFLGFGYGRDTNIRQVIPDYKKRFEVKPFSFSGGWGIEFTIPVSFIRIYFPNFALQEILSFKGNFYKCGDETPAPHYLSWSPIEFDHPEFHLTRFFGDFILEK